MLRSLFMSAAVTAAPAGAPLPAAAAGSNPAVATACCPALLDQTFPRLQDEKPQSLRQYAGKVLLVVNTASSCGLTPQYQGLGRAMAQYASTTTPQDKAFVARIEQLLAQPQGPRGGA